MLPRDESVNHSPSEDVVVDPGFYCSFSHMIMREPRVTSEGEHYEEDYINHWLKSNLRSPAHGAQIELKPFAFPDIKMKRDITALLEKHPKLLDEVYLPATYWEKLFKAIEENNKTDVSNLVKLDSRLLKMSPAQAQEKGITFSASKLSTLTAFETAFKHNSLEMINHIRQILKLSPLLSLDNIICENVDISALEADIEAINYFLELIADEQNYRLIKVIIIAILIALATFACMSVPAYFANQTISTQLSVASQLYNDPINYPIVNSSCYDIVTNVNTNNIATLLGRPHGPTRTSLLCHSSALAYTFCTSLCDQYNDLTPIAIGFVIASCMLGLSGAIFPSLLVLLGLRMNRLAEFNDLSEQTQAAQIMDKTEAGELPYPWITPTAKVKDIVNEAKALIIKKQNAITDVKVKLFNASLENAEEKSEEKSDEKSIEISVIASAQPANENNFEISHNRSSLLLGDCSSLLFWRQRFNSSNSNRLDIELLSSDDEDRKVAPNRTQAM